MDRPPVRQPRLNKWVRQAAMNRRVFPYLAGMTLLLGMLAGLLATIVDRKDFPNYGVAVWWAVVTLGTVGYGDVVPHTAAGRVVGCAVIVVGVTFISFLTATVTSFFVSAEQETANDAQKQRDAALRQELVAELRAIEDRLTAIEAKLDS